MSIDRADMVDLRRRVFVRDNYLCMAWLQEPEHVCGSAFAFVKPRDRNYRDALTLEHVRTRPGGARRDAEEFCVTLCYRANVIEHWGSSTDHRAALNNYLDRIYPNRRQGIDER